jgi:hypothetical protein
MDTPRLSYNYLEGLIFVICFKDKVAVQPKTFDQSLTHRVTPGNEDRWEAA